MLQLKLDHSRRVAAECRTIASELGWQDDDRRMAEVIGILHDIGRFPQFAKYRTFFDPASLNHGECGYNTMRASVALRGCEPSEASHILDSIRYHNRRCIPDTVEPLNLPFLKLIRDADKLDILFVVNDTIRNKRYKDYPEIMLNITLDGPPTPELIREIYDTGSGRYENVRTLADMNLMRLSWVYDMNYKQTFHRLQDRHLLEDMYDTLPDMSEIQAIIAKAQQHITKMLSS
jgi:HD superfamily phosphohydrolase YqeK